MSMTRLHTELASNFTCRRLPITKIRFTSQRNQLYHFNTHPFSLKSSYSMLSNSNPNNVATTTTNKFVKVKNQKRFRSLIPIVIQREDRSERSFDIFSRLLRERVVFVTGEITDEDSNVIVAQLLFLESEGPDMPISLYINSPGGSVTAGLAIYDTIQFIQCPIHTLCLGQASSMASILVSAGQKGYRHSLPNTTIMIHQPSGGASGQASDLAIRAKEILRIRSRLIDIYQFHCSKTNESSEEAKRRFEQALDRDYYLTPEEAKEFGLIDDVISHRSMTSN